MTTADRNAFLADPQAQIAKLTDSEGARVFDIIPEYLDELGTTKLPERDRKQLSQSILSALSGWHCQRLPAHRRDWLYAEEHALFVLHGLYWVARLVSDQAIATQHRAQALKSFVSRFQGESLLEAVRTAPDQRQQADGLIRLTLAIIVYLRSLYGTFEVDGEHMLVTFDEDPQRIHYWPPERASDAVRNEVMEHVANSVTALPVTIGLLLSGSLAVDTKRDNFSDIDLCCLCSEVPDEAMRASLLQAVAPEQHSAFGSHQFLALRGASVDLAFVTPTVQDQYFEQLRATGQELPFIHWSHLEFAISAYHWSFGRILSDTDGVMAAYREGVQVFPTALKHSLIDRWASAWESGSSAFAHALGQDDWLSALTALHTCWESVLRMLMTQHDVYSNPLEPKWIPMELANLPAEKELAMKDSLQFLQMDVMAPLGERFRHVSELWETIIEKGL